MAGLLERRPGYYGWKIAVTIGMLAAGWTAFAVVGNSWWLAVAAFLAVVFTQIGFLGHDAGYRQIFSARRASDMAGILLGNLGILSCGWWVDKHNCHHAHPNQEDAPPPGGRGPSRVCTYREPASMMKKQYKRWSVNAQSTWKKSTASMVDACVRRNCRHVMSVCRFGAGGIFSCFRIRRIVEALTRCPSLSSSR